MHKIYKIEIYILQNAQLKIYLGKASHVNVMRLTATSNTVVFFVGKSFTINFALSIKISLSNQNGWHTLYTDHVM